MGLPIVRDLAQLYGGEIRLENSIKGGLRAILELPRARTDPVLRAAFRRRIKYTANRST